MINNSIKTQLNLDNERSYHYVHSKNKKIPYKIFLCYYKNVLHSRSPDMVGMIVKSIWIKQTKKVRFRR